MSRSALDFPLLVHLAGVKNEGELPPRRRRLMSGLVSQIGWLNRPFVHDLCRSASAAREPLMGRIRNLPKRLITEACFVAVAWVLAGVGYLLSRQTATEPFFLAGVFVVAAEFAYDVNTYASNWIGGRAVTPLGRFANRLSFVLLWPAALVSFAVGTILLITSQHA